MCTLFKVYSALCNDSSVAFSLEIVSKKKWETTACLIGSPGSFCEINEIIKTACACATRKRYCKRRNYIDADVHGKLKTCDVLRSLRFHCFTCEFLHLNCTFHDLASKTFFEWRIRDNRESLTVIPKNAGYAGFILYANEVKTGL